MNETEGFVAQLTLTFFHERFAYTWEGEPAWEEHYWKVRPGGELESGNITVEDLDEQRDRRITLAAEKFLTNKAYLEADKSIDRRNVVMRTPLDSPLAQEDSYRIASLAEKRYQADVQPAIDAEIIKKIKVLLQQKPKLVKAFIQTQLGLTRLQTDHYWHEASRSLE